MSADRGGKNPFEKDVAAFVDRMIGVIEAIKATPEPFGQVKRTEEEQLQHWVANKEQPEYWQGLLSEQPMSEVIRYDRQMRKLEAEYGKTS